MAMARWSAGAFVVVVLPGLLLWSLLPGLEGGGADADSAPDGDPCRDRPFKNWAAEIVSLGATILAFTNHFDNDWYKVRPELREKFADKELLQRVNPCALHIINEYKDKPGMGDCTRFFMKVKKCREGDAKCAKNAVEHYLSSMMCYTIDFAHFLNGDRLEEEKTDLLASPFPISMMHNKTKSLKYVEDSASLENKKRIFKALQNLAKLVALGYDVGYPIILSGAVCENADLRGLSLAPEVEEAGPAIANKIAQFFELSKEDQVECTDEELMWEYNECGQEIKKSYGRKADPGDCTAHYLAATGKCRHNADGEFDYNICLMALGELRKGVECYVTRLARDAMSGFTTYDSDKEMGGTALFERDHYACLADGWLSELEADPEQPAEVRTWIDKVYRSYKRLDTVGAFGCEE